MLGSFLDSFSVSLFSSLFGSDFLLALVFLADFMTIDRVYSCAKCRKKKKYLRKPRCLLSTVLFVWFLLFFFFFRVALFFIIATIIVYFPFMCSSDLLFSFFFAHYYTFTKQNNIVLELGKEAAFWTLRKEMIKDETRGNSLRETIVLVGSKMWREKN